MSGETKFEHVSEQIKAALAHTPFRQICLSVREGFEIVDRFYGEIARSVESGESVELTDLGPFSRRDGFSSRNTHGSGVMTH